MLKNSIIFALLLAFSGCDSLLSRTTDEDAWNEYFKELKIDQRSESRSIASEVKPSLKILKQILEGLPFRNYLLACESRDCFQSQLVLSYDEAFRRVKDQGISITNEEYVSEQKVFLDAYSYENVSSWVNAFHKVMISGVELRASQRAIDLSQKCDQDSEKETNVQLFNFSPYLGGITYLPKYYYSCLNRHWKTEQEELLKEVSERLGILIKTEGAKNRIIQQQVAPIYIKTLNDLFLKKKSDELEDWKNQWSSISGSIDWKKPIEQILQENTPLLRERFHFLNIEVLLTEKKSKN